MAYSKIIIPSSLHPDTILAIFLLKKFGASKYPCIDNATIEIRQILAQGDTAVSLKAQGVICLDIGGGGLDHHASQEGKVLSQLVAQDLGILQDPALAKLLAYAERDDKFGMGTISTDQLDRAFGLSGLISSINRAVQSTEKSLAIIVPVLDAYYTEEYKRTVQLPKEFEETLKNGKAEIFEVKQRDKKLKAVAVHTDNASMAGWLKASTGLKADMVLIKTGTGYVNILTKPLKRVDLRHMAAHIRNEELQFREREVKHTMAELMAEGKIHGIPEWYYDGATNSLLNGGVNPNGIEPTIVPFERIIAIAKNVLDN